MQVAQEQVTAVAQRLLVLHKLREYTVRLEEQRVLLLLWSRCGSSHGLHPNLERSASRGAPRVATSRNSERNLRVVLASRFPTARTKLSLVKYTPSRKVIGK